MSNYNQKPANMRWDQSGFEALKKSWSAERRAQDQKDLTDIFNFAAKVPAAKEALEWGLAHGVEYMIDHQCQRLGGYYQGGTGVVALSHTVIHDPVKSVSVVAHETRHAWQDQHGFLQRYPLAAGFTTYFIKTSLIEADAYAYELRVRDQAEQLVNLGIVWPVPETVDLPEGFLKWFSTSGRPVVYGDFASKDFAQAWGIPGAAAVDFKAEFETASGPLAGTPLNLARPDGLSGLGETFSGACNYWAQIPADKKAAILDVKNADCFYGAANDAQCALVAAIHEKEKRAALELSMRRMRR